MRGTMTPQMLDINEPLTPRFCIENWLRDEQIKINIQKVKGRIAPSYDKRQEPIAVVCFGPSLNDTWEKIREFKYVMTCSGAHKFLVERAIIPTHHCEVDPRKHKIQLVGQPQKETEYLIASACHPEYLDHLEGYNVKLWHVFDSEEEGIRVLPRGEWALTGGSSVGLRALTIARFLGFTKLHVFGMDGCAGKSGKHAAEHPSQPKDHAIVEYQGVEYQTTPSMLACAKQTAHELDQMPDVEARFYGEGLVQAMMANYKPKPVAKGKAMLGFTKPELISVEYAQLNAQLHRDNLAYGVGGGKHAETVLKLAASLKTNSILDYGCGKGYLAKAIPFPIWEYDPAISGKEESPRSADLVCCLDVLEHVEPEKLSFVLDDLRRVVRKLGFFVIHTGPSGKHLADGRNAHVLQRPPKWWKKILAKFFHVADKSLIWKPPLLYAVVVPKIK